MNFNKWLYISQILEKYAKIYLNQCSHHWRIYFYFLPFHIIFVPKIKNSDLVYLYENLEQYLQCLKLATVIQLKSDLMTNLQNRHKILQLNEWNNVETKNGGKFKGAKNWQVSHNSAHGDIMTPFQNKHFTIASKWLKFQWNNSMAA